MSSTAFELNEIITALYSSNDTLDRFLGLTGAAISSAIHHVLDGLPDVDCLEAPEKTYIGTKVEKRLLESLGLPAKTSKGSSRLDTVIGGHDVDIKFTLGKNWMIPPEAVGSWCLVIQCDAVARRYSVGFLKMEPSALTEGANRDGKRSVSAAGKKNIFWVGENVALPDVSDEFMFARFMARLESRLFTTTPAALTEAPASPGVYALFADDALVYIGKSVNLRQRLRKHARSISRAEKLATTAVTARTIACDRFQTVALEEWLIAAHAPAWNRTGFGSNAHGAGRANQRLSTWNELYGRPTTN